MEMARAKQILDRFHAGFVDAHLDSTSKWRKLNEDYPEWTLPFDAGERAQQLHSHVGLEIATRAESWTPDAVPTLALDFFALKVGPEVLVRFKHLGPNGPRNYPTEQQNNLARQMYDVDMLAALELDTPPTLLTCGYRLEPDGMTLAQVVIRWDMKFHPSWEYPIYGEAATSIEPLRLGDMPPEAPTLRSKRARDGGKETQEGQ